MEQKVDTSEESAMDDLALMAIEHQRKSYRVDAEEASSLFGLIGLHNLINMSDEAANAVRNDLRHTNLSDIEEVSERLDDLESESAASLFQHLNPKFAHQHNIQVEWGDEEETVFEQSKKNLSQLSSQQGESLSELISVSLLASVTVYGTAEMRALIREGKIEGDMSYPVSSVEQMLHSVEHTEDLKMSGSRDSCFYVSALTDLANAYTHENFNGYPRSTIAASMAGYQQFRTLVFDDGAREPVYSISVDPFDKVLIVTFRGSVAVQDWIANSKPLLFDVTDPRVQIGFEAPEFHAWKKASKVGIHKGLRDCLFTRNVEGPDGVRTTKYKVIIGHLERLLGEYVGYRVRVTGHSLGGALATLFSFYAACEDWMPPLVCITFGSPRVGNTQFLKSFRRLEEEGRLQHLRIVNHLDPVALLPNSLVWYGAFVPDAIFRQVGMELRLFRKTKEFYAPRKSFFGQCVNDFWAATRQFINAIGGSTMGMHSCQVYLHRLDRESDGLATLTMSDLYKEFCGEQVAAKFESETTSSQMMTAVDDYSEVSC